MDRNAKSGAGWPTNREAAHADANANVQIATVHTIHLRRAALFEARERKRSMEPMGIL